MAAVSEMLRICACHATTSEADVADGQVEREGNSERMAKDSGGTRSEEAAPLPSLFASRLLLPVGIEQPGDKGLDLVFAQLFGEVLRHLAGILVSFNKVH